MVITLYMSKGIHHYITCQEPNEVVMSEEIMCNPAYLSVCLNTKDANYIKITE